MGNDIQVNQLIDTTKESFLNVPFSHEPAGGEFYNLETEFAGTKKNRSYFVTLLMLGFFALVGAGAWILYLAIEEGNKKFDVQVVDFEELKIREAFDALQKDRATLATLTREIQRLSDEFRQQEQRITLDISNKKEAFIQSGLVDASTSSGQIASEGLKQLEILRNLYLPQLETKKLELQGLQEKVATQESDLAPLLQGREAFTNNQQKLFDRQREDLATFYENRLNSQKNEWTRIVQQQERARAVLIKTLNDRRERELADQEIKYNPLFEDPKIVSLVGEVIAPNGTKPLTDPGILIREGVLTQEYLDSITADFDDLRFLMAELKKIPYVNSIPGVLQAVDSLAAGALTKTDALLPLIDKAVEGKNQIITEKDLLIEQKTQEVLRLQDYLLGLAGKIGGDGYILAFSSGRDYKVVLRNSQGAKAGDKFRITRNIPSFGGSMVEMEVGELDLIELQDQWIARLTSQKQATVLPEIQDRLIRK